MANRKKYKIFDYCWHIPHQSDMVAALHDDCEFTFCLNIKRQWNEKDSVGTRPLPVGVSFVTHYEPGLYDLAILHIDQQAVTLEHQKRIIYDDFNSLINDIPKIVINHGTPVYPEGYVMKEIDAEKIQKRCVEDIRTIIGNNTMVVNSYDSASEKEWGFGVPIIHGMDPDDWWDLPKEPRVFTAISSNGLDEYYNRRCLRNVDKELLDVHGYFLWHAKKNIATHTSFDTYRDFLGRSLLYLDVSQRTPMNRSRTEAMLSGCCVVQVEGAHDLERWAIDGENIVIVPNDPKTIAKLIVDIVENKYSEAVEIGRNAKEMATKTFNRDNYRNKWLNLIEQVKRNFIND